MEYSSAAPEHGDRGVQDDPLVDELERIRNRGIRRLDQRRQVKDIPIVENIANALAAADGREDAPRWQKIERLFEIAIDRPETEYERERLRALFGLSGELRNLTPRVLMNSLREPETKDLLAKDRSNEESLMRAFRRRNRLARVYLAEAMRAVERSIPDSSLSSDADFWYVLKARPREVTGVILLLAGGGAAAALATGLASDYGVATGVFIAAVGSLFGRKAPKVIFLAVGVLLTALLAANMARNSPPQAIDGVVSGFLLAASFIGRMSRHVAWPTGLLGERGVTAVRLAVLLTSLFWFGLLAAAIRRAGDGSVASNITWAATTALPIGWGMLTAGFLSPRKMVRWPRRTSGSA
jgi:hypothetical protein